MTFILDSAISVPIVAYSPGTTITEAPAMLPVATIGAFYEDSQSPVRPVPKAPHSSSAEFLPATVSALGAFYEDSYYPRRPVPRSPRSTSSSGRAETAGALSGVPWNSSMPIARFDSSPRTSIEEPPPALTTPLLPWNACLDGPAVFSRYTIITPDQHDDLPPLLVVPSLGFVEDPAPRRPAFPRPPRSTSTEQLAPYVAPPIFVPFVPSTEIIFIPTFLGPIFVPFIPSGEVVPPPSFTNGVFPDLILSAERFFVPTFARRPELLAGMLDGGTPASIYRGGTGKLYLSPLDQLDARTLALRTLRRYLSLLTFRREVAPGEEKGRAFRLSLDQIHVAQPKDSGGEANLPSLAFLPGVGSTDTLGLGGINIIDDTLGVDGDGTAVARYGEYEEQFTIEVVATSEATRNGLVAGLKQAFRMQMEWNETLLIVPELFGATAEFSLDEVEYVEDPYADQNRRRALLRVSLTVPELFIARGVPLLDPRILLELGAEIVILPRVDEDEL